MTNTLDDQIGSFARNGLGVPGTAEDIRNQYKPAHGDGNLPDDKALADAEEVAERQSLIGATTTKVDIDLDATVTEVPETTKLRSRIAELEKALEGAVIENQMFRRFHASIDDNDRKLFMQSVIFLASTALDYKFDEDRLQEFFEGKGECLHPENEIQDTGFGVTICRACKKHVEPAPEYVCAHEDVVFYGTVGAGQCKECREMIPREAFSREDSDVLRVVDAVGVSIPKGQPRLNPGLAPRELPSAE